MKSALTSEYLCIMSGEKGSEYSKVLDEFLIVKDVKVRASLPRRIISLQ